jgi:hypothetical protein
LLDDLLVKDYDKFINVSCLYLGFIKSNNAFEEYLNSIELPFETITAQTAGEYVVNAIKNKAGFQVFPPSYNAALLTK